MAAAIFGRPTRAWATCTFSWAAPRFKPHLKFSQCAQERNRPSDQPSRRSNSAISRSQRYWAAFNWPASSVICASRAASVASRPWVRGVNDAPSMGASGSTVWISSSLRRSGARIIFLCVIYSFFFK